MSPWSYILLTTWQKSWFNLRLPLLLYYLILPFIMHSRVKKTKQNKTKKIASDFLNWTSRGTFWMSEVIISTILFFTVLLLTSRRFQCGSCQTLLIEYAIWEPKHITNTYCIFPLFPSFPTSIFSQDRFFNTFPFKIYL